MGGPRAIALACGAAMLCACLERDPEYETGDGASTSSGSVTGESDGADGSSAGDAASDSVGDAEATGASSSASTSSGGPEGGESETGATSSTDQGEVTGATSGGEAEHQLFVTSETYTGDFGGIAEADARCQSVAEAAGLAGRWRAVISVPDDNAADRLMVDGPVQNMSGETIAFDRAQLWSGTLATAPGFDELGNPIMGDVWTGSAGDGISHPEHCSGWTGSGRGRRGLAERADGGWISVGWRSCTWLLSLYCLSQ